MVDSDRLPPLTDSPWFWFALFAAVGWAALVATGGKFGRRQANIERKYQARTAVAAGLEVATGGEGRTSTSSPPNYSTPRNLVIPLWPLQITLALICLASFAILLKQRGKTRTQ